MSSLIPESVNLEEESADDLQATVAAAGAPLTPEQRADSAKELVKGQWPTGDPAKVAIYITGFIVAGIVLCLCVFLAWKAQGDANSIASDIIVAASSFVSLLLGGLVGAYVQK